MKKSEREFIGKVKAMPCIICNAPPPSDFHHITYCGRRLGQTVGIPLCYSCHRGELGFSGKKRGEWDKSVINQLWLAEQVKEKLNKKGDWFESY